MLEVSRSHVIGTAVVLILVIGVGAATFYVASKSHLGVAEETKQIFSGDRNQKAIYKDINGNEVSLESYLGKVLVVSSWASWSPFSANDLVVLNEVATRYSGNVTFLAINRKETKEQAIRYLSTLPELENIVVVLDPEDRFYGLVGGYAMPETLVFDRSGQIILHQRGALIAEQVTAVLDSVND